MRHSQQKSKSSDLGEIVNVGFGESLVIMEPAELIAEVDRFMEDYFDSSKADGRPGTARYARITALG